MKDLSLMIVLSLAILYCGCSSPSVKNSQFVFPAEDSVPLFQSEQLSEEAIDDISRNITSPVEIADILQRMSVPFTTSFLASSIDASRQNTSFKKAIMLGILGADLGYLNMYEKTGNSIDILSSIKKLAEDINVGQFFDFDALRRLSLNRTNLDSLLYLSLNSYNQIDKFLREKGRGQLSALMITGVWIEGQYIATQVLKQYSDTLLHNRVGEQKVILNDLIMLLAPYCNLGKEYSDLCSDMKQLKDIYRGVKITYTIGEPRTVEKDGSLIVVQTDRSRVEMTDEQLKAIISTTEKIRNRFISNN